MWEGSSQVASIAVFYRFNTQELLKRRTNPCFNSNKSTIWGYLLNQNPFVQYISAEYVNFFEEKTIIFSFCFSSLLWLVCWSFLVCFFLFIFLLNTSYNCPTFLVPVPTQYIQVSHLSLFFFLHRRHGNVELCLSVSLERGTVDTSGRPTPLETQPPRFLSAPSNLDRTEPVNGRLARSRGCECAVFPTELPVPTPRYDGCVLFILSLSEICRGFFFSIPALGRHCLSQR